MRQEGESTLSSTIRRSRFVHEASVGIWLGRLKRGVQHRCFAWFGRREWCYIIDWNCRWLFGKAMAALCSSWFMWNILSIFATAWVENVNNAWCIEVTACSNLRMTGFYERPPVLKSGHLVALMDDSEGYGGLMRGVFAANYVGLVLRRWQMSLVLRESEGLVWS